MTPRSLFAIIIKIIGIYLLIGAIVTIPQMITTLLSFRGQAGYASSGDLFAIAFFILITVIIYVAIMRYCLFKTDWLIDKLHLDKGFAEERLELNIHRSTVLQIAVIVIGCVMVIDNLPLLCREVFVYFQMSMPNIGFKENPSSKFIVIDFAKFFIGLFLMTSSRLVVNFIERKRKGPSQTEDI
ncbi:MAG: hypothetical protein JST50_12885 [Bacteroidetes bacterium]|jgi:hydrogenase-4 membrane subunit HyfE|nr:hypothetical protein [Bacteroidota bacterium]